MAIIETWLKTDLQHVVRVQELDGNLFTADNGANRIGVIVTNNGEAVTLVDGITGYFIRPDEATVAIVGEIQGNLAWIDLPSSCYVKTGPFSVVLKSGRTTLGACSGYMRRSTTEEIIDPGHMIPSLEDLLAEIANMRAATAAANTAAGTANAAASNADEKAGAAITAAGAANSAASAANAAAGTANTAADNANQKAAAADEAATNANARASEANTAAGAANTAASNANEKATAANNAATAANTAAGTANTAAANADQKAAAANSAAGTANTAAGTANTAAGTANAAATKIDEMTVVVNQGDPGSAPTVTLELVNGHYRLTFSNVKGLKGDTGDAFHVVKTYASVAAMMADYSGTDVQVGEYVMVVNNVEDPDNAKVYIKGSSTWNFVVDMSGATGIKGDTGTGIASVSFSDYMLTLNFTDGTSYTTPSIRGAKGETGATGNGIASIVLNQDYTLTINMTDGTRYTTDSIRGPKGETGNTGATGATGNGISSVVHNQDYTLTINMTDGTHYTTGNIRGEKGEKGDTGEIQGFPFAVIDGKVNILYKKRRTN